MSSKNTGKQLKIRYKNLPQSSALKNSPTFNQNKEYFQKMLLERKKAISEVLSFKTTKKSVDNNYSYFSNLRFKADLNVLNLVNVADFSKTTLIDYIKDISSKKKITLSDNASKDPKIYLKELYLSKKITLEERFALKFLLNFYLNSKKVNEYYKEYSNLQKSNSSKNLSKLKKELEKKESRDIKNALLNSRISSQDSKESKEAIESIRKYYFQVFQEEKRNFLENKKIIENLNKNISLLLPEVIASADLIEFISLKKFIETYKK